LNIETLNYEKVILLNIAKYARTINPSKTALKVPKIRAQGEQSLTALPWVSVPKSIQPRKGGRNNDYQSRKHFLSYDVSQF
jgi:hypothetical protein